MSEFKFNCPHCQQSLEAPEDMLGQTIECPSCNGSIQLPEPEPQPSPAPAPTPKKKIVTHRPSAASRRTPPRSTSPSAMPTEKFGVRQIVGIVGTIVLFIGVFTPIVSVPIMGNMNYFQNGKGDGTIVLVLAVLSLVSVLIKKDAILFFTSLGCLGTLTFTFVNFKIGMSRMLAEASSSDDLFSGLAELAASAVQLQWGWALLVVGACLTLTPIFLKSTPEDSSQREFFKLAAGWRVAAGALSALCLVAVIVALVWPAKATPAASSSGQPATPDLGSIFSAEPDEPAEPPKQIPSVPLGSAIVIDDVKISVRRVRVDHIERQSMFGDSTTRSDDKYLLVELTLQNTSPGKIIYLQQIWEHTKLIDNFDNIEGAEYSDGFMTDSIVGYIGSTKLMPGDTENDMIIFELPVDAARSFRIESDPRFWKSVGEDRVRELSDESFKIEFTRNQIR